MTDPEYEILPHKLLSDLKFDVEALKKKLTEPDSKASELILEIESLKDSIHELNTIFQKALDHAKEDNFAKQTQNITKTLDSVVSQNETIAKGLLAISDKLEEFMQNKSSSQMQGGSPSPMGGQHSMGMPPLQGPGRMAPRPSIPSMTPPSFSGTEQSFSPSVGLPPPPPHAKKRHSSLGGLFK